MHSIEQVRAAMRGDEQALVACVEALEVRLYQTVLGIVGQVHDAQDVWQMTVVRAWRSVGQLRQPEFFATCLTRIALNEATAHLRARRRRPLPLAGLPTVTADGYPAVASGEPASMAGDPADRDDYLAVHACLQKLRHEQREAVLLRFWLDLSLAEVAEATGVPLSTAKTRLYQGLRVLRQLMEEAGYGERETLARIARG